MMHLWKYKLLTVILKAGIWHGYRSLKCAIDGDYKNVITLTGVFV